LAEANGNDEKTLGARENRYYKFDFRFFQDGNIRSLVKDFIWGHKEQRRLRAKQNTLRELLVYFTWAEQQINLKSTGEIANIEKMQYTSALSEKLFTDYYLFLKLSSTKGHSFLKNNWQSLRLFVKFLKTENHPGSYAIFEYIEIRSLEPSEPNPLSPDEVNRLIHKVKELLIKEDCNIEITWNIIQLLLSTNFRTQEILNLKRDCLDKAKVIKDGSYPVWMQRKGSDGKYITVPTDAYTHRIIKAAITKTEFLATDEDKAIGRYVFIKKGRRKNSVIQINIEWFEKQFAKLLESIELKDKGYTPYNLRDTYMTELLLEARRKGKSLLSVHALTDHASIVTTLKHYDKPDIRDFLEAFSGIIIGDVTIRGEIVKNIQDAISYEYSSIKEITVKDGCGVCGEPHCKFDENDFNVDCMVDCKSFKVPVDRLPLFLEAIKDLDSQIVDEDNYHEKEHLVSKKKLYLAYVDAIYKFKASLQRKGEVVG